MYFIIYIIWLLYSKTCPAKYTYVVKPVVARNSTKPSRLRVHFRTHTGEVNLICKLYHVGSFIRCSQCIDSSHMT